MTDVHNDWCENIDYANTEATSFIWFNINFVAQKVVIWV